MDCAVFHQMLDNYANLTEEELLAMAEHCAVCEECRHEYDFFNSIVNSVKTLPELEVPKGFAERVNKRIDAMENKSGAKIISIVRREWSKYSAIAACLVVAVVIGLNGRMLVSKMTPEDNGIVISEETMNSNPETTTEESLADPELSDILPEVTGEPVKFAEPKLSAVSSAASADRKTPLREAKRDIAPTVTPKESMAIVSAAHTAAPEIKIEENSASVSDAPESSRIETKNNEENSYSLQRNRYKIPSSSSKSYDVPASEANSNVVSGYSLHYDVPASEANSDISGYAMSSVTETEEISPRGRSVSAVQSSGSIYVAVQDSDEFMSIMNSYISGSEGNYYLISSSSLSAMLSELSASGISYGDFIQSSASEQIAFSVVFF